MTMAHPTIARMQAIAEKLGSKAKTPRGILTAINSNSLAKRHLRSIWEPTKLSQWDWKAQQQARKLYPEAKRARDRKDYRALYLKQLRRREKTLTTIKPGLDGWIEWSERKSDICKELEHIAKCREIATSGKVNRISELPESTVILVSIDPTAARKAGASIDMRGKDAQCLPTRRPSYGVHASCETFWKNGKPKSYTRATHDNYVRSIAFIVNSQMLDFMVHETRGSITLPDRYEWHNDHNGLCVRDKVRTAADYHVEAIDFLVRNPSNAIIATLESGRERRERLAAESAILLAQSRGVYVGVADSVRAGNCPAGTRNFAKRHNLDPSKRYPAEQLFAIANGDAHRVRIAIAAAVRRHKQEITQVYCDLEK